MLGEDLPASSVLGFAGATSPQHKRIARLNCATGLERSLLSFLFVCFFFFFNGDVGFIAIECSGSEITGGFNSDCDKSCEKYKCL